jgi:hypothetical protein
MKEGFANTVNTSDPDLIKSITTLAQVCKDLQAGGLKIPGNLTVTGTIKTGDDLNDIASRLTKLEKLPSGMRLFQMTVDNTFDMKVVDSDNKPFNSDEWVCSVQGLSMDWTVSITLINGIYQYCYIKDNEWWIRSAMYPIGTQIGKPIILAIPKKYFEIERINKK